MATRVTESEKERMRELRAAGMTYAAIVSEVGYSQTTIACVCNQLYMAAQKAYQQSDRGKEVCKVCRTSIASKSVQKKYRHSQSGKAVRKEANDRYRKSEKGKAKKAIYQYAYQKTYRETPHGKALHCAYQKEYQQSVNGRLGVNLRSRLHHAIKNGQKAGSAVRDLGCTIQQLKAYLESKFRLGMSWDNWALSGWHIDHIKPLASFDLTDREQFLQACHFTNLQPLWAKENLSKGSSAMT